MRIATFALLLAMALGLGLGLNGTASAAPINGPAIGNAAASLDGVQKVWWDQWGRWHPDRPVYVAPPVYIAPPVIGPVCRTVRVCNRSGTRCWRERRCY
jgi:hypothetical protein